MELQTWEQVGRIEDEAAKGAKGFARKDKFVADLIGRKLGRDEVEQLWDSIDFSQRQAAGIALRLAGCMAHLDRIQARADERGANDATARHEAWKRATGRAY